MQLNKIALSVVVLFVSTVALAQQDEEAIVKHEQDIQWLKKTALTNVQVNILGSYYSQDGNHSTVTGGLGTEKLSDIAPAIIVNIPLDSTRVLSINAGADIITSASTDNIDFNVSSDSRTSLRYHVDATYTKKLARPRLTYSIIGGFSKEYDVFSKSVGAIVTKETRNGNSVFSLHGKVYFDAWDLYFPVELRQPGDFTTNPQGTDNRNSYNFGGVYSQVLSKRLQVSLSAEVVIQDGLLNTPFHRVFFNDGINVDGLSTKEILLSNKKRKIENLPRSRTRVPIGIKMNYFLSDLFVLRGMYRYYSDDFGVTGNSFSLDVPTKITSYLTITPFYRYHTQTASRYFQPFGQHDLNAEFYSSDYDQSALNSNKFGLGIRYSPLYDIGIFKAPFTRKSKNKFAHFKAAEVRLGYYNRSDGLSSSIVSFDLSFDILRGRRR
jgi:uncharacterized protein DUF3570